MSSPLAWRFEDRSRGIPVALELHQLARGCRPVPARCVGDAGRGLRNLITALARKGPEDLGGPHESEFVRRSRENSMTLKALRAERNEPVLMFPGCRIRTPTPVALRGSPRFLRGKNL